VSSSEERRKINNEIKEVGMWYIIQAVIFVFILAMPSHDVLLAGIMAWWFTLMCAWAADAYIYLKRFLLFLWRCALSARERQQAGNRRRVHSATGAGLPSLIAKPGLVPGGEVDGSRKRIPRK
jgi:hypothetical protein